MDRRKSSHTPMFDQPKVKGSWSSATVDAVPAGGPCAYEFLVAGFEDNIYPGGGTPGGTDGQIFVRGDYCYVYGEVDLAVIDISDKENPVKVGGCTDASIQDLRWGAVFDYPYLYVAEGDDLGGFHVFNVSNPTAPTHVAHWEENAADVTAATIGGLVKIGDLIYGVDWGWASVFVVDVSTPSAPVTAGYFVPTFSGDGPYLDNEWDIVVEGGYLYASSFGNAAILIFDVSNPASITRVGYIVDSIFQNVWCGLVKQGNVLYVANEGTQSFISVNVTNPAAPAILDVITSTAYIASPESSFVVEGDYAYVAGDRPLGIGSLSVIDISDPSNMIVVGNVSGTGLAGFYGRMLKDGNRIVMNCGSAGDIQFLGDGRVVAVNVFTPTSPFVETYVDFVWPNSGLAFDGSYFYSATWTGEALYVISICQVLELSFLGSVNHATNLATAYNCAFDGTGNYVVVTCYTADRVTVVDATNRASPSVAGTVTHASINNPTGIDFRDNSNAIISNQVANSVVTVSISTPSSPSVTGTVTNATTLSGAWGVFVSSLSVAAVPCEIGDRLTIVNIGTPTSLSVTGSVQNTTSLDGAIDAVTDGFFTYVAAYLANRVTVVDIQNPASPLVVGSVQDNTHLAGAISICKIRNHVFVACDSFNGICAVNVDDPLDPQVVGYFTHTVLNGACGIARLSSDHVVVVSSAANSLALINVHTPAVMVLEDSIVDATNLGGANEVDVYGTTIAVACMSANRLSLYGVSPV